MVHGNIIISTRSMVTALQRHVEGLVKESTVVTQGFNKQLINGMYFWVIFVVMVAATVNIDSSELMTSVTLSL